ncbi:MAG: DUF5009 domain-containing protein [Actinobacteria bacterium]|nr:DUF5009 domain-containing protein [Actinomycetota bacterium]
MNNSKTSFKKKNKIYYGLKLLVSDLIFSALSCFLAYYLRFFTKFFGSSKPTYSIDNNYILYSIIFIMAMVLVSLAFGLYFWDNLYKKPNYYLKVAITPVLSLVITLIFGRAYAGFAFSRLWILTLFILSILLIFFSRLLIGKFTKKYFAKKGISTGGLVFEITGSSAINRNLQQPQPIEAGKLHSPGRILSIDALRGFDMLWILGASELAIALLTLKKTTWTLRLAQEFDHVSWNGFAFYDLIFPLFLFIVGLVIPFSLAKYRQENGNLRINFKSAYIRIITRTLLLFFLGLLVNGLLDFNFSSMRWPGVLQRIAICYFFASIITLYLPSRFQPMIIGIILGAILIGYWAVMKFVPVPGVGFANLSPQGNLAGYLDRLIIPGRLYYQSGDNEGLISTLPALGTTLLGVLTGFLLKADKTQIFKIKWILISGVSSLILGIAWSFNFPVNKILWTSSYVLFAGGLSLLLLGLFYWLIDYKGYKKWAFSFIVIGMNAITIYVVQALFDFGILVDILIHGFVDRMGNFREVFFWICMVAIKWLFLYFLYKKKIFLKI